MVFYIFNCAVIGGVGFLVVVLRHLLREATPKHVDCRRNLKEGPTP